MSLNCCFLHTCFLTVNYSDSSFIYSKGDDGYMITVQQDFAEMLKVDMNNHRSKYIRLEAPLDVIRKEVQDLINEGYKKLNALDLEWRVLIP